MYKYQIKILNLKKNYFTLSKIKSLFGLFNYQPFIKNNKNKIALFIKIIIY